jgi:glycosyltransferase involved in cell wall biosynthesis
MNLLVFAPFFPPDPTGSSVFAYQQAIFLSNRGHSVLVLTNEPDSEAPTWASNPDQELHSHGIRTLRLRNWRLNLGSLSWNYRLPLSIRGMFQWSVWKHLRRHNADAVIIHSTLFDLSVAGLLWCLISRKKNVLVCHTALWHDRRSVRTLMFAFGFILLRPLCILARSEIVCVDKFTFQNAKKILGGKLSYSIVPVSVDIDSVSNGQGARVKEKYGINGSPVLLSLGHVIPLRNRINLVKSLPLLVDEFPDIEVVVVGMVKDNSALVLAEELGVTSHLKMVGAVPHSEIGDFLDLADVEAHDLNGLGLGITSVEAIAAGTVIVAWVDPDNYPTMRRNEALFTGFINDGEASTIAAAITRIVSDFEGRETARNFQRDVLREVFSAEAVNNQYLELLQTRS